MLDLRAVAPDQCWVRKVSKLRTRQCSVSGSWQGTLRNVSKTDNWPTTRGNSGLIPNGEGERCRNIEKGGQTNHIESLIKGMVINRMLMLR